MTDNCKEPNRDSEIIEPNTSSSLLQRVEARDSEAWQCLVKLYYPLIYGWCRAAHLQSHDATDVSQEVFRGVMRSLHTFHSDGGKNSFRGWLRGVTRNKMLEFWKQQKKQPLGTGGSSAQQIIEKCPDLMEEEVSLSEQAKETAGIVQRAAEIIRPEIKEVTWKSFWRTTVEEHRPSDVASDLGVSTNSVYLAKSRVLRRLREELRELLELDTGIRTDDVN